MMCHVRHDGCVGESGMSDETDRCGYCGQPITPEALAYIESLERSAQDDDWEHDYDPIERGPEYVEPTWRRLDSDPDDESELSKCACCNRFFVTAVPIRLFSDLGDGIVLGYEVCDSCAQRVVPKLMAPRVGAS